MSFGSSNHKFTTHNLRSRGSQGIPRSELRATKDVASMGKRPAGDDREGMNSSKRPSKTARLDHWLSSNTKITPSSDAAKPKTTIKPPAKRIPLSERPGEVEHATFQPTKASESTTKPTKAPNTLTLTEERGDIFASPSNSVLIHACNCEGRWGAGIALAFKKHYPKAYDLYHKHCEKHKHDQGGLRGTALLIPPVDDEERRHYIGCLFTSFHVGFRKDSRKQILQSTKFAMQDLLQKVKDAEDHEDLGELRMCQINAGSFNVPWKKTVDVLEAIEITEDMPQRITVVTR